ncbi:MAG: DUF2520 domain-containing protein [Bacteroidales bacterium]|nr:DUF2520 domain-containing protein [Bacteroidales bacterium]MCB9013812.1 DUF2520 domain-containing protein [Bacteroidales bacterium]
MKTRGSFVSIGAGNVATHMVPALCKSGYILKQVFSRTDSHAMDLAGKFRVPWTCSPEELTGNADFYMLSLPDSAITELVARIQHRDILIFHTAGSVGMDVFANRFHNSGVLYPLQTFSRELEPDISKIPILIEASDSASLEKLKEIAGSIAETVIECSSEDRRWIHLAGVFACNFTNHMYAVANDILRKQNIDPAVLRPLIEETFRKSLHMDPAEAQTGPAVRRDTSTLKAHIKMLDNRELLQKIYTFTSQSIQAIKPPVKNKSDE